MLASVILHLLLAQLAWTLTVVNLMQREELLPPYLGKHRTTDSLPRKHGNLKNKPREFFEQELRRLSSNKTCIKATDTINKKGLEASYMGCYRVASTGKPRTIVEDFIIPPAADMVETMPGGGQKKLYRQ